MNIQQFAQSIADNLTTITVKDDGERIVWKDSAPREIRDWFSNVNTEYASGMLTELDECYRVLQTTCYVITDQDTNDQNELEEAIYENEWADIYNHDLLEWVRESLYRIEDVNEALQNGCNDLMGAIQQAQESTRSSMASSFLQSMVTTIENGGL